MYIAPGRGRQPTGGQKVYDNRMLPICCKFKMIFSKSDSIHIFNDFIHVYSPRARAENPLGTNFWCQQKALITSNISCKFQTNLFEFLYTIFNVFHMYIAPGQGQGRQPFVDKILMSTEKPCHFAHLLQVSKQFLWSRFNTYFFMVLYMYIAPGQGQTTPWGQNFYINIKLFSVWSFAINDFLTVFPK